MLVKRIIPSLSLQGRRVTQGVLFVSARLHRDNTRGGYDLALTRTIACAVGVPVIASRVVGTLGHIDEGLSEGADGALCTSIFHNGTFYVANTNNYFAERGLTVRPAPRTLQPREMS